jgi:hypothetical protein
MLSVSVCKRTWRNSPTQSGPAVCGWKREAMPTRYIGKYDESELMEFPTAGLRELLAR